MEVAIWDKQTHAKNLEKLQAQLKVVEDKIQALPNPSEITLLQQKQVLRLSQHRTDLQAEIAHEEMFLNDVHVSRCIKWHMERWAKEEGCTEDQVRKAIYELPAGSHRIVQKVQEFVGLQNA